jgi:hypothetical protein
MKRITLQFSALLAALFLFAFSCQDHYVPEEPKPEAPVVQTLALTAENQNTNLYRYKLNVEKLGNVQITGYGVVFSAEFNSNAPFTKTPTIADNKVVFSMAISTGEKFKVDGAPPVGYKTIYYRAYVTYGVNSVAYGNVMEFSPVAQQEPGSEALKIKTLQVESPINGEYGRMKYGMVIEKKGSTPIKEFGIVISLHNIGDNDYTDMPTVANQTLTIDEAATEGEHTFIEAAIDRNETVEMFYRAYIELSNGEIAYGETLKYIPADIVSLQAKNVTGRNAPISVDIDISYLGSVEVEEYGVVYSYKVNANDPVTSAPTLTDHKAKSVVPIKLGKQTLVLPIPGNSVKSINVRPYVKYKNGNVYYGNQTVG